MSYYVDDPSVILGYRISHARPDGKRYYVNGPSYGPDQKSEAESEAKLFPEGKVRPKYGRKLVKTDYPTCPKCGHQGKSKGIREYSYNGGGEYFECLNPECLHEWCWS